MENANLTIESATQIYSESESIKVSITCEDCGKVCDDNRIYIRHKKLYCKVNLNKCLGCGMSYKDKADLEKHEVRCRKSDCKRIWSCRVCDITFKSRGLLRRHKQIHGKRGFWSCRLCDATFKTKVLLNKHKTVHGEIKKKSEAHNAEKVHKQTEWNCNVCGKQCKRKSLYYSHLVHKHPESTELAGLDLDQILKYVCHSCGKRFASSTSLSHHELIHKGKTVPCPDCKKLFISISVMRRHQNIHSSIKRYNCSYCGRMFSFSSSCKAHELTHKPKSQRPFQCSYEGCSAAFTLKAHLSVHWKTHMGVREYCPFCNKGFTQKSALRTHIKMMHEQYKPYTCSYEGCNAAFSRKVSLKEHTVEHTGQFPFECPWCYKGFKQKGNLKSHMNNKHGQTAPEYSDSHMGTQAVNYKTYQMQY